MICGRKIHQAERERNGIILTSATGTATRRGWYVSDTSACVESLRY